MDLYSRDGVFYAECYYYDSATDRRVRRRRSTGIKDDGSRKAKDRARIVGEEIERSLALGRHRDARPTTLKQAFEALIEARTLAGRGNERALYSAGALFEFFGPDRPARGIDDAAAREYAMWRTQKAAAGTVRRELSELNQALKASGFPAGVRAPKMAPYRPRERWLPLDEIAKLMAEIPPLWRDHAILYLQLGVRLNELYRLEAVGTDAARIRGTKTKKADRVIPLTPQALGVLTRRQWRLPRWVNTRRDLLAASARAGIEPVTTNDLRRTYTTELAQKGASPLHLKELLGHTTTRMVDQVYARTGYGPHLSATVALLSAVPAVGQCPPDPTA